MKIEIERKAGITVVRLVGEMNSGTVDLVQEKLLELVEPGCKIALEMSGVTYISSMGLRTLLLLYREISQQDGHIVLCGLTEMVYDTMFITGFLEFFETYETCGEGRSALAEI
ncbi:MAG: STAS domain-containing protein [Candidatus Promineifilaceae bacterium]|jgi:anti-sigma B factor antagonist